MTEIIRLAADDYEEAVDFINMVFSMEHSPHNFPRMLPKLYSPDSGLMSCHYAIRKNSKIRAIVGSFPMNLLVAGQSFKAAGIGSVSSHPADRGSGYMRLLMQAALQDMQTDNVALSVLGGQRQRYNNFGYETAGSSFVFNITPGNIRRLAGYPDKSIDFIELSSSAQNQAEFYSLVGKWHSWQPVHVERNPDQLSRILASWYCRTWLAMDKDNTPLGYLVETPDKQVSEFVIPNRENIVPAAAAWVKHRQSSFSFAIQPWQIAAVRDLSRICEDWRLTGAYQYRIFDWPSVLTALMQVKAALTPLPEGSFCFSLTDLNLVYKLTLNRGAAFCVRTDEKPDLELDQLTAIRLFLGPALPFQILDLSQCTRNDIISLLTSWLPLPVGWSYPDAV